MEKLTFNISQDPNVLAGHKVNGNTLPTKSSRTADTVDVVLSIAWEIVIDDQADLLNINTTSPDICRNQHSGVALAELVHDCVSLLLKHLSVHAADGEVGFTHLLCKPINLTASVAEDDGLCDRKGVVELPIR